MKRLIMKLLSIVCSIILVLNTVDISYADNTICLVVWSFTNELQGMIEKYYAPNHPEIEFEFQIYPTDGDAYTSKLDKMFSGTPMSSEAPDVFTLEAAFVKKYINSGLTGDLHDIGLTDAEMSDSFSSTAQIGMSTDGVQRGLSWQSTPGVLMYRASLADKYLGISSPEVMQQKFCSWEAFLATARELKIKSEGACKIICGLDDIWNVYQYYRNQSWVVDGRLNLEDTLLDFEELCKILEQEDLTQKAGAWGETWFAGMRGELETLCYFLPTWGLNYTLKPNCVAGWDAENPNSEENIRNATENGTYGDWRMTVGPTSYIWGGTHIVTNAAKVAAASDARKAAIRDLIYFLTLDKNFQTQYAADTGDFVNSRTATEEIIADGGRPDPFLGGQDPYTVFNQAANDADGSLPTEYDNDINELWNRYVTIPYSKGEKDLDTCIAEFKAAVAAKYPDSISVTDEKTVSVQYTYSSEKAMIGQPFTINYEIKGGSGQYEDITYRVDEITEHCCIGNHHGDLSSSTGSFTITPESGESIEVWISCIDTATGVVWNESHSKNIACEPNSDISVDITDIPEVLAVKAPFAFSYSIGGNEPIEEAKAEVWEFIKGETCPDRMFEQVIVEKTGSITYTPMVGNQLYIAIIGKDDSGRPFYAKTNKLDVDITNAYEPVTVEYTYSTDTPQIGYPFTVNYEIKGGSGQYEEISYRVDEITEHCCIGDHSGELSSSNGSFTIIPESGENIECLVSCRDSETGKYWSENKSGYLTCDPNPDTLVEITNISADIILNEQFSFSYTIDTEKITDTRVEVWAFVRNDTYPDRLVEQRIFSKTGTLTFTAIAGNQLFIVIRGKDSAERPFYIKSRRLSVYEDSIATLELSGCWNFNTTAAFGIEQSGFIGLEKNVACFGLYDEVYTRMKQYYGGGPSWSFIIDEGTAVLNAESCNEASGVGKGQYFNFNVAQWPTQAENRVITIACNWANKLLIAQQTIRFVYQAPPSAFITPSVLVIKTGMQKDIPWTIEPNGWCLDEDSEPTLYWEKQTNRGWIWTNDPWTDDPGIYTVRMVYNSANVNVYSAPIFLIITRSDGSFPKEKYATKQMSSLQLPSHIHAIADQAFVATATEQIIIPSGCSTIGVEAFANSPNLKEIRIPASVTQIDKTALDGCGPVFILTDSAQVLEQASKNDFWIPVV